MRLLVDGGADKNVKTSVRFTNMCMNILNSESALDIILCEQNVFFMAALRGTHISQSERMDCTM